jgi:hypothetical protein
MKRVRKPNAPVAAVGAEAMVVVVVAEAVAAIVADAVVAADAAVIAATVGTAATAGKIPHLSLNSSLTSGALLLRPKSFAFQPRLRSKIHSPSEFVLANPWPSV